MFRKVVQFKSAYPHTPHRERQDMPKLGAALHLDRGRCLCYDAVAVGAETDARRAFGGRRAQRDAAVAALNQSGAVGAYCQQQHAA